MQKFSWVQVGPALPSVHTSLPSVQHVTGQKSAAPRGSVQPERQAVSLQKGSFKLVMLGRHQNKKIKRKIIQRTISMPEGREWAEQSH